MKRRKKNQEFQVHLILAACHICQKETQYAIERLDFRTRKKALENSTYLAGKGIITFFFLNFFSTTSKDGFADFENSSLQNSDNYDEKEDLKDNNDSTGFFSTLWELTDLVPQTVRFLSKISQVIF